MSDASTGATAPTTATAGPAGPPGPQGPAGPPGPADVGSVQALELVAQALALVRRLAILLRDGGVLNQTVEDAGRAELRSIVGACGELLK